MKDRDNQFLFESYMHSLEEGRKKQFKERERKTVIDPTTGEERKESYYEMMMRLKGKAGPRSKALKQRKEKKSEKVRLQNREFQVSDKAYQERLNTVQRDIVRFIEADDTAKSKDIMEFLVKTGMDSKEAEVVLSGMITDGFLDEVNISDNDDAAERRTNQVVPPTAMVDTEYDEYGNETDLEDY